MLSHESTWLFIASTNLPTSLPLYIYTPSESIPSPRRAFVDSPHPAGVARDGQILDDGQVEVTFCYNGLGDRV